MYSRSQRDSPQTRSDLETSREKKVEKFKYLSGIMTDDESEGAF